MNIMKKISAEFIIIAVCALIMAWCVFLPYASATPEYGKFLDMRSDMVADQLMGLTASDMKSASLFDFAGRYSFYKDTVIDGSTLDGSALATAFYAAVTLTCAFSLAAGLFGYFKKPIVVIICAIGAIIAFSSVRTLDSTTTGAMPNAMYGFGIGFYLFYVAAALMLAAAVVMLVRKKKQKNATK